jgi:hypothetical protein
LLPKPNSHGGADPLPAAVRSLVRVVYLEVALDLVDRRRRDTLTKAVGLSAVAKPGIPVAALLGNLICSIPQSEIT